MPKQARQEPAEALRQSGDLGYSDALAPMECVDLFALFQRVKSRDALKVTQKGMPNLSSCNHTYRALPGKLCAGKKPAAETYPQCPAGGAGARLPIRPPRPHEAERGWPLPGLRNRGFGGFP